MSSHIYHDRLPGYDERQIWYDGCPECERRSDTLPNSLMAIDADTFNRAWNRADLLRNDRQEEMGALSNAEMPLLRTFEAIQIQQDRVLSALLASEGG